MPTNSVTVFPCVCVRCIWGKYNTYFIHLDTKPAIFLWSECCSFENPGIKLPAFFKILAPVLTEVHIKRLQLASVEGQLGQ